MLQLLFCAPKSALLRSCIDIETDNAYQATMIFGKYKSNEMLQYSISIFTQLQRMQYSS